jgi:hypothetical protein
MTAAAELKFVPIAALSLLVCSALMSSAAMSSAQTVSPAPGCDIGAAAHGCGWPLQIESIRAILVRTLGTRARQVAQAKILAPPDFTSREPAPELQLKQVVADPETGNLFAIMRCRVRQACGTFLVEMVPPHPAGGNAGEPTTGSPTTAAFVAGVRLPATAGMVDGGALVRPHELARMVIEQDGLRISQPVVPLQPGRMGEVVRVRDPLTRRFFWGEVSGPGTLRPGPRASQGRGEDTE